LREAEHHIHWDREGGKSRVRDRVYDDIANEGHAFMRIGATLRENTMLQKRITFMRKIKTGSLD
jgi:hypothetical protein